MAEGHIFGKAFFYYVCLDIMLYSGERGRQIFEAGAVTRVLVWRGRSQGGARGPLDGEAGSLVGGAEAPPGKSRVLRDQHGGASFWRSLLGRSRP